MQEFPDRCKQSYGSASEVKEEAKMSFKINLHIFFSISQTKYYKVLREHVQFLVVFSFFEKTTYCCRARRLSVRLSSVEIFSFRYLASRLISKSA